MEEKNPNVRYTVERSMTRGIVTLDFFIAGKEVLTW